MFRQLSCMRTHLIVAGVVATEIPGDEHTVESLLIALYRAEVIKHGGWRGRDPWARLQTQ